MSKRRRKQQGRDVSPPRADRSATGDDRLPSTASPRRWDVLCCVALFVGTFLLYVPSLSNEFVNYDDQLYVTQNATVQRGLTWEGVKWAFTTTTFANWLPITWLSHMLDVQLWGLRAGGHHATSALLHAANAAMVYLLVRRATLCGARRALAVALLFAAHPLRVESVSWVAERKDVLAATFFLMVLLAYVRYTRMPSFGWYLLILLLDALGLMSKTMLVTVPGVLLLMDYWPLRRMRFSPGVGIEPAGASDPSPVSQRGLLFLILEKLPVAALSAVASAWTYVLQKEGGTMDFQAQAGLTLAQRVGNAIVSVPRYLWKTVRPIDLSAYYPHPGSWPPWAIASSAALILLLTALTFQWPRRRPWLLVGWFWFLGMLLPVIGIIQVGSQSMADRYTYLPGIGLTIALVWTIAELAARKPSVGPWLAPAVGVVTLILAVATLFQQRYWRTTLDLFEHAVIVDDRNWVAHGFIGVYYQQVAGDHAKAVEEFERTIELQPRDPKAHHQIGVSLMALGRVDDLIARCRATLSADPNMQPARIWLGIALERKGDIAGAAEQYAEAARRHPEDPNGHAQYGLALARLGRIDEAREELRTALRLQPGHPVAVQAMRVFELEGQPATATAPTK